MEKMIEILFYKLGLKGLQPLQIPGLVRNVVNIVLDDKEMTTKDVNQRLKYLGWEDETIDGPILELIVNLFENGEKLEAALPVLH